MKKKRLKYSKGFKDRAEEWAAQYRRELGKSIYGPLNAWSLAAHLKVPVRPLSSFPELPIEDLAFMHKGIDGQTEWFGITLWLSGEPMIVHNCGCPPHRQQSDLMHELAHIICGHKTELPPGLEDFPFMRKHDEVQENEAAYLGAALLVSLAGLRWRVKEEDTDDQIAAHFDCSIAMVRRRLAETGARKIRERALAKAARGS